MDKLVNLINRLELKIPKHEMANLTVSAESVGWHIEHSLLAINKIIAAMQQPRVAYKWSFNIKRILVLNVFKIIPRGRAKAPKQVRPQEKITVESINKQLIEARKSIKLLAKLDQNLFLEHPYFGHLKVKQTKKLLEIHSKHHLKIIDDIIKKLTIDILEE